MTAIRTAVLALLVAALAVGARAGDGPPVLVELFTSQGCSSCPPADRVLGDLAGREDVVALALHVDYWDYLGWRDTFADARFTRRQVGYRDALSARAVYTPQMVIQGAADVVGSRRDVVEALIAASRAIAAGLSIEIAGDGGSVTVAGVGMAEVWAALYDRRATVDIARGENAGRRLAYHNIVRRIEALGSPGGAGPATFELTPPAAGQGVAVWVQEPAQGRVLAAAKREP